MENLISVIIPVYNCRDYLNKCIESVLSQEGAGIELILIDDGSNDGSGELCDEFERRDARVHVIHQMNGGVSRARNAGLDCARGEWILFIDADDYVKQEYCERMLSAALTSDSDVVIARPEKLDGPQIYNYSREEVELLKRTCLAYDETKFDYNIDGPWAKLFRGRLIRENGIRFPEKLARSEDAYFCATVYEHANRVCCLNWFGYGHIEREGSLCRRYAPDAVDMLEAILEENQKWVERYHPGDNAYLCALWHRVLPGIDECERMYFLHERNAASLREKAVGYQRMIGRGRIHQAIASLRLRDVPRRQYKVRLLLYKLRLGWLFVIMKLACGRGDKK